MDVLFMATAMVILTAATTGGKMKKLFLTLLCLVSIASDAMANGDIMIDTDIDQYNYIDNRRVVERKTIVKNRTIVKEVPVPVPVPQPYPVPAVPAGIYPRYVPSCRMQKAQPIVDPVYGIIVDYLYVRVCY